MVPPTASASELRFFVFLPGVRVGRLCLWDLQLPPQLINCTLPLTRILVYSVISPPTVYPSSLSLRDMQAPETGSQHGGNASRP